MSKNKINTTSMRTDMIEYSYDHMEKHANTRAIEELSELLSIDDEHTNCISKYWIERRIKKLKREI